MTKATMHGSAVTATMDVTQNPKILARCQSCGVITDRSQLIEVIDDDWHEMICLECDDRLYPELGSWTTPSPDKTKSPATHKREKQQ